MILGQTLPLCFLLLSLHHRVPDSASLTARIYRGMCDASGGVGLDDDTFAVANDEDNKIRIYSRTGSEFPLEVLDLSGFLGMPGRSAETDLEGAALLDGRIYWIGSHGRNREGKDRPNRRVLFATALTTLKGRATLMPVGKPYRGLLTDLISDPALRRFSLARAAELRPKDRGALNIEGLCAMPDHQLLIGFRNPIPRGRALLVPLKNPAALMDGKRAIFGEAIELELDGFGIRDLAFQADNYFILGGPYDGNGTTRLYRWKGPGSAPELAQINLKGYNPEALIIYPHKEDEIQILSDDGTRLKNGKPCKELQDATKQTFRSLWLHY